VTAGGITAEPPIAAAPPPQAGPGRLGRFVTGAIFLTPAAVLLVVWMVYPAIYTIVRSFFGQQGFIGTWVGFDHHRRLRRVGERIRDRVVEAVLQRARRSAGDVRRVAEHLPHQL